MEKTSDSKVHQQAHVSTGAGIAIAGIWIAGSSVTIVLLLITFVLGDHSHDDQIKLSTWDAVILLLLLAAPMIVAYNATRMILNRD